MALAPTIYEPYTDTAIFVLLTIEKGDGSDVSYLVNNNEPVNSRGKTFEPYPFDFILPNEEPDAGPRAKLTIDNVDLRLIEYIRGLLEPPVVTIEIVLSITPDVVERSVPYLRLSGVQYDAQQITGTLVPFDPMNLPAVDSRYNGTEYPDLVYR